MAERITERITERTPDAAAQSLRARAYENFRQQILQANVQPGQFVSQRELMQLLDMPKQSF